MLKVKLLLISGGPGYRVDFVAGWLGTLPNFLDNHWCIDPATGQSYGHMRFTKMLDKGMSFDAIWRKRLELSPEAEWCVAGSFHGYDTQIIQDKIQTGAVDVVSIVSSDKTDFDKISWEFYVKTYLSRNKISHLDPYTNKQWLIDQQISKPLNEITAQDRINAVDTLLQKPERFVSTPLAGSKKVEFDLLFCKGGSKYLCDILQLDADNCYHKHWDYMLSLSDSPDTLEVWGHAWCRKDYFNY